MFGWLTLESGKHKKMREKIIMRIGNNRKWKKEKKENKGMWDHTKNDLGTNWVTVNNSNSSLVDFCLFFA